MLADQSERPLLQPKLGAFLYAHLGPLAVPPVRREHRHVGIDAKSIIAPVTRGDHSAIEVEDPHQLPAIECGDWAPVPTRRERRDDAQALFTFGCGWGSRAAFNIFSSARNSSSSCSSSLMRTRTGSQSSPHGVP